MIPSFQLLYTRISHDLSGVAGAVYNGAELIEESVENVQDAAPILMQSAESLIARLRFFRQAFGLSSEKTEDVTQAYLKTLSAPFVLHGTCETQLQKILCFVLSSVMIYGGEIYVDANQVWGESQRSCAFPESLSLLLMGVSEQVTEQTIPAWAAALAAQREGVVLEPEITQNKICVRIHGKKG